VIVVLDTNALHSDVYLNGPTVQTFLAAAAGEEFEIWVPSVVVEELVRQLPERLNKLDTAFKKHRYEVRALGIGLPDLGDLSGAIAGYRSRLEQKLDREGVKIVGPPKRTGRIAEWIAQRREPIPNDGRGAVDTQIWLTAIEAGEEDQCVLVAKNPRDFADDDDDGELHPVLKADMEEYGLEEDAIVLCQTIRDFLQRHVEPNVEAIAQARALLADQQRRAALVSEIEGAIEWFPLEPRAEDWSEAFGEVDIDDAALAAFDVEIVNIVRADIGADGTHVILEAYGTASLELGLFKYEAGALPEDSTISIEDWDLNESMASASAEVSAALVVEVLLDDGAPAIAVEEVEPIGNGSVQALLETWADGNPDACLDLVSRGFDVAGTQVATAATPTGVKKLDLRDAALLARADFSVDYDNPVDDEDQQMSANNVTDVTLDLKILSPDFERGSLDEVLLVEGVFPD